MKSACPLVVQLWKPGEKATLFIGLFRPGHGMPHLEVQGDFNSERQHFSLLTIRSRGGRFNFCFKPDFCLDSCYSQYKINYFNLKLVGGPGDKPWVYFPLVQSEPLGK